MAHDHVNFKLRENLRMTMTVQRLHVAKRFSEIAISGNLVHLAGQLASDFSLDIKGQTQQTLDIIDQFLADAGTDKSHIMSVTIYLKDIDKDRIDLPDDVIEQVNINIKYDGYIQRQNKQVLQFKKLEKKVIPEKFDYDEVGSLRTEARQKLKL